jgi:ABC-type sugar transport system ATPase subunit
MTLDNFLDDTGAPVPLLEVRNASMRFGAVTALNGVSLSLNRGEVLALLGDNGAGKSTMIKCISGVQQLTEGEMFLDGEPVSPRSPAEARELGIETVYQDLALFDNMSASQNFFAGREITRPAWLGALGVVNRRAMNKQSAAVLERLQVGVHDPNGPVGLMSGGQRQAVAVARAEAWAKRIVILDEPTAALGVRESRNVLDVVKKLPRKGISVILISHNLEEVMALADRAIVFRQGRLVGEIAPTPDNHERIVSMIVGASDARKAWS